MIWEMDVPRERVNPNEPRMEELARWLLYGMIENFC
jgi:hypothetical protein